MLAWDRYGLGSHGRFSAWFLFDEAFIAATGRCWEHFSGAAASGGIETVTDRSHDVEVFGGEQSIHKADFFYTNSMLASDTAAEIDTFSQDFVARLEHAGDLFGVSFIE